MAISVIAEGVIRSALIAMLGAAIRLTVAAAWSRPEIVSVGVMERLTEVTAVLKPLTVIVGPIIKVADANVVNAGVAIDNVGLTVSAREVGYVK